MTVDQSLSTKNSVIGEDVQLYYRCDVLDSIVGNNSIVGEQSRVRSSNLGDFVKIDRNNLIYHSKIGYGSYTGSFDMIFKTQIGKYCSISYGTTIGPPEHDYRKVTTHPFLYDSFYDIIPEDSLLEQKKFEKELIIKNDVWIGCGVTILRGITIGDGAVIGANSLVNKDVPPYAIVVGNPARIVKYRFSPDIIKRLLDISWWNWSKEKMKANSSFFTSECIEEAINNIK